MLYCTEDHIFTRAGQISSALAAYRSLSVDLLLLSSASLRALDVRFPILTNAFLSYQCMPQMPYHMRKGPQTPRKLPPFYALDADLPILLAVSLLSSFVSRKFLLSDPRSFMSFPTDRCWIPTLSRYVGWSYYSSHCKYASSKLWGGREVPSPFVLEIAYDG